MTPSSTLPSESAAIGQSPGIGQFGRWRRLPIRWRLTIWYGTSLCLLLIGFSALVWAMTDAWLLSQTDAELAEELAELLESIESSVDEPHLRQNVDVWSQLHEPYGFEYEIRTVDGVTVMQSRRVADANATLSASGAPRATLRSYHLPGVGPLRVEAMKIAIFGQPRVLWIAVSQVEQWRLLHHLLVVLLTAGLVVLAGAIGGGYFLSRRVLRPVEEIAVTAARISANHLKARIAIDNPHDELGRLAVTLNTMLDRLDQSFAELKRFTADAAHELRTPLTLLRSELEVSLRTPRSADAYEETLRSALADTIRMSGLAEQLLELARGDSGTGSSAMDPVPLPALLTDIVAQLKSQTLPDNVTIELGTRLVPASSQRQAHNASPTDDITVSGDSVRLRRLFFNLLDNAVKYTPSGGRVRVHTESFDDLVQIIIEDSGCGIASDHLPRVFDRFYRVDASRAAATGGSGLGLSICQSIVESHGGTIVITSEPLCGTRVTVALRMHANGAP